MRRFIAVLCLGLTATAASAQDTVRFASTPYVAAVGHAEEERVPDRITVRTAAAGTGLTGDQALKDLDKRVSKMLDAVKKAGLPDEDTTSSGPTLEALYKRFYDESGREIMEKRQPNGFRATYALTLQARMNAPEKLGQLLPVLAEAGAVIDSIAFSVSDEIEAQARLEDKAVADAVERAKRQIVAAGAKPGRILSIGDPNAAGGEADLARPMAARGNAQPYSRDFSYALRPGKQTLSADRRVLVEILP